MTSKTLPEPPVSWTPCPNATTSPPYHTAACYRLEVHPCPRCRTLVTQTRAACHPDTNPKLMCPPCSLQCPDCNSEVRTSNDIHYRVIHSASCPWWRRYQAGGVRGLGPCGTTVTHRGPYKRDPGY